MKRLLIHTQTNDYDEYDGRNDLVTDYEKKNGQKDFQ